jgi:hypothetical protein
MRHINHIIHRPRDPNQDLQRRLNEREIEFWKEEARDLADRINGIVDAEINRQAVIIQTRLRQGEEVGQCLRFGRNDIAHALNQHAITSQ